MRPCLFGGAVVGLGMSVMPLRLWLGISEGAQIRSLSDLRDMGPEQSEFGKHGEYGKPCGQRMSQGYWCRAAW